MACGQAATLQHREVERKGEALEPSILAELVRDNVLSITEASRRANLSEAAFEAELKKMG